MLFIHNIAVAHRMACGGMQLDSCIHHARHDMNYVPSFVAQMKIYDVKCVNYSLGVYIFGSTTSMSGED